MVERNLIARTPGVGRALQHRLTAAGVAMLEQGQQLMNSLLASSFEPLDSADRATLHELLLRVLSESTLAKG